MMADHNAMRLLLLIIAVLTTSLELVVVATSFTYNNDMKCQSPASIAITELGCGGDDSSVCDFGDRLEAQGTLTLSQDIPDDVCLTLSNCFMGISFICKTYQHDKVNLCNEMNLDSASDGSSSQCPYAGTYTFDADVTIPDLGNDVSLGSGWWVTSKIALKDCDSGSKFTSCKLSFSAVSSGSSSATAYFVGFSALGLVAAVAVLLQKRRRRRVTARIDLQREEQQIIAAEGTNYERMHDGRATDNV
jgi:hypothetical protein